MEQGLYSAVLRNMEEFKEESKCIFPFLKSEAKIKLDFTGYTETLLKSLRLECMTFDELCIYANELLAWSSYFREIQCVIKSLCMTYENKELYLSSFVNRTRKNKKIDSLIQDNERVKSLVDSYNNSLIKQTKIFEMILGFCRKKIDEDMQKYNR